MVLATIGQLIASVRFRQSLDLAGRRNGDHFLPVSRKFEPSNCGHPWLRVPIIRIIDDDRQMKRFWWRILLCSAGNTIWWAVSEIVARRKKQSLRQLMAILPHWHIDCFHAALHHGIYGRLESVLLPLGICFRITRRP